MAPNHRKCMCVSVNGCMRVCVRVCVQACLSACMHVCMGECKHVCQCGTVCIVSFHFRFRNPIQMGITLLESYLEDYNDGGGGTNISATL